MSWWDDFADTDTGSILDDFASGADDAGDFFVDTVTGDVVSAADIQGMGYGDMGDMGSGGEVYGPDDMYGPKNYDWEAASEGETGPGQATPEQVAATSPYNAAGGSGMDWLKALGQGLSAAKGLLGGGSGQGGLAGLAQPSGGGAAISGLPGLMAASIPQVGGVGAPDIARVGAWGQPDLSRPDIASVGGVLRPDIMGGARMQDPISAALTHLQPADLLRLGFQAPIDPGPAPRPFSPLVIPTTPAGGGGTAAGGPRMSGLQRLMLERFG